jgi:molybdopterin-guanine dinucleotide biosynthesis protein A
MSSSAQPDDKRVMEFQAVILAGGAGNRLYPLTTTTPKPLLPMVNRPLLSYQLQLLETAGFSECIVVTTKGDGDSNVDGETPADLVAKYIGESYRGNLHVRLEAVDGYCGTADALRQIADALHTDFFVISGDVVTDESLHYLADAHRSRGGAFTALLQQRAADDNGGDDDVDAASVVGKGKGKAGKAALAEARAKAAKATRKRKQDEARSEEGHFIGTAVATGVGTGAGDSVGVCFFVHSVLWCLLVFLLSCAQCVLLFVTFIRVVSRSLLATISSVISFTLSVDASRPVLEECERRRRRRRLMRVEVRTFATPQPVHAPRFGRFARLHLRALGAATA